ncbi:hypothetical protein FBUS_07612 [Fasciolopsis buskii]|uniref:Uncharacterized protein n=1 Tax=Fasciolopsis buskii TaxID=27845 RepID=A0A8E0RPW4_9TREM|nr:hypothetical protein FBUS_07612 [Fasciolopsis buski]
MFNRTVQYFFCLTFPSFSSALTFESSAYEDSNIPDGCQRSYRACVDRWISMTHLYRLLGQYLDVNPKCVKLIVTLTPCVEPSDVELSVSVLDLTNQLNPATANSLTASTPLWPEPLKILCRLNWTVEQVIEMASTMLKLMYGLEIPRRRLCLRKCSLPERSPGPWLDPTSQLCSFRNPHQGVLLQLLDDNMPLSSMSVPAVGSLSSIPSSCASLPGVFLFFRRWYPSTLSFALSLFEVFIPLGSDRLDYWYAVVQQICQVHHIAPDNFRFTACKFPGRLHCLSMESATASPSDECRIWIAVPSPDLERLLPGNGQIVYFKDADEPCKILTPEELQSYRAGSLRELPSQDKSTEMPALTYGPTLPPSYSDLTSSFGPTSVKRTYEQPLRIYTAEDHPATGRTVNKLT